MEEVTKDYNFEDPIKEDKAELLKSIKFPEESYRKYCGDDKSYAGHKETSLYLGMECKQNRAFIGLPLNRKKMISHIQLSQFRSGITFVQAVNLMVYFLTIARKSGFLDSHSLHCVDSTELPVDRHNLLASLTIKGSVHEFKCAAEPGECFRSSICPQYRHIPFDQGCFQRHLSADPLFKDVLYLRKNCERSFNLMKKREGLEELRVRRAQ